MIESEGPGAPPSAVREAEVHVEFAVMRQRFAEVHLAAAVAVIERAAGAVEAPRALDIYGRLHHLGEDEFQVLKNGVLAHYGRAAQGAGEKPPTTFVAITGDVEWDVTASLFHRVRKRLAGRRHVELRHWIELHTGRTEMRLLRLHVEGALRVVELLPEASVMESVQRYVEAMHVRDGLAEAVYIGVLDRLFDREHPAEKQAAGEPDGRTLRLVSGG